MTIFARNIKELNGIITIMKKIGNNYRVHKAGYTVLHVFTDENGIEDEYEAEKVGFVVDNSDELDGTIEAKAFIAIEKEHLSKQHIMIDVDRVNKTIDLRTSETSFIHLYDFWTSAALSEETVELLTEDTFI